MRGERFRSSDCVLHDEEAAAERWMAATTAICLQSSPTPKVTLWEKILMSAVSTLLPQLPRVICDVASRRLQTTTVTILAVFVIVMVLLEQPLAVAAGVAGWL